MIKRLALSLGKKYAISALNDLLEKYKDNVQVITAQISKWIERLQKIISQLELINKRVADGKLDDAEVDDSVKEVEALIKDF